ncbi:MAG: hypothetical protein HQL24_09560 [Candidatus Omnitrophica bacterium]|nr:hypothetical protein [Candidatus Omnitrophota bacterium]
MLRKLFKNKKAQNTAEYAILISLVVAAIVAMQTYAQRSLQARIKDSAALMTSVKGDAGTVTDWSGVTKTGNAIAATSQYEPYYLSQSYNIDSASTEAKFADNSTVGMNSTSTRNRNGYSATANVDSAN